MLHISSVQVTQYAQSRNIMSLQDSRLTPSTQMLTFPVDREKDFSIYLTNECGKKLPPIFLSGEGCLRYSPDVPGLTQQTAHNKTPRESRLVEFPPMSVHCSLLSLILLCHKFCCKIIFFSIFHKFYTSELSSQNSALTVYYLKYLRKIQ